MSTIIAPNQIGEAHLAEVMEAMRLMGAPEIRAIMTCNGLLALEGSHRLEAAWRLGLDPAIIEMADDDPIFEGCDIDDMGNGSETCGELAEYVGGGRAYKLNGWAETA